MVGINVNSLTDGAHVIRVLSDSSTSICATDLGPLLISRQHIGDSIGHDSCVSSKNVPFYIYDLIYKAYGASLIHSDGGSQSSILCKHWSVIF